MTDLENNNGRKIVETSKFKENNHPNDNIFAPFQHEKKWMLTPPQLFNIDFKKN